MNSTFARRRHRKSAWLVGGIVLVALAVAVTWMLVNSLRSRDPEHSPGPAGAVTGGGMVDAARSTEVPELMRVLTAPEGSAGVTVRGVVALPDGHPAASATVTLYRLITAWPEWQRQPIAEAITREDGAFQFRCAQLPGHLVGFEHEQYAGGEQEVSVHTGEMQLRLRPGFSITGYVVNDLGAPVPNARVSVESVPGEHRRARWTQTSADGGYSFDNLPAGPAHLVARHESWQPAAASGIVIGDRTRSDFRFERPSMSPLRGRVLAAASQEPIAGAIVELVPINQQLGLVDPISTTTAKDGTFLLDGLPRGSMRMWVRHPDYGIVKRTQTIGAVAHDLTIDLAARTSVTGRVVADEDGIFEGGEVLELRDNANELSYAVLTAEGAFAFPELMSPGIATIRVLKGRFLFRNLKGTEVTLRLDEADDNELEIDLQKVTIVRGRFVDADNQPMAGVRVVRTQLLSDSVKFLGSAAWQGEYSQASGQLLQLFDVDRDQLLALSDDQGRFEVRGFRPGGLLARADAPGFGSRWLRMVVPQIGRVTDMDDVQLSKGCGISGRVLRGGQPFAGATVTVVSPDCQAMAATDENGFYRLRDLVPGDYSVRARISGRPTGSNEKLVKVAAGKTAAEVDIGLDVGRMVRGTVKNEKGQPLAAAVVSVRGRPSQVSKTDSNGVFAVELPRRDVELVVSLGDRANQMIVPVTADQEDIAVVLDTPPTCTLVARVAGLPGRRRLAGVLLRLTELSEERIGETQTRWVETRGGELRKAQVPSGDVRIEIWCDGYAPHQEVRTLKAGQDNDLGEVLLAVGAGLRGVVTDAEGSVVRDAMVLLGEETDFDLFSPSVRSGADGSFEIRGVTSRSSSLVVRHPAFAARTIQLQLPRDVLSAKPLPVVLQRGTTIEVVVPRNKIPDDGLVYLRRGGHLVASTVLDDRGYAWFANRSAGKYSVVLFGSDLPERDVEIEAGVDVHAVRFGLPRK